MRLDCLALVVFALPSLTFAADGPWMRGIPNSISYPKEIVVTAPYATLGVGDHKYEAYAPLLQRIARECDQIIGVEADADDTSAREQALLEARRELVTQKLQPLPGQRVKVIFEVSDVSLRIRPPTIQQAATTTDPNDDSHRFPNAKYLITADLGRFGAVRLNADDRTRIDTAQDAYRKKVASITELSKTNPTYRTNRAQLLAGARNELDNAIASIRKTAEQRLPAHRLVVLTGDDKVLGWKTGQKRAINGTIYMIVGTTQGGLGTTTVVQMMNEEAGDVAVDPVEVKPVTETDAGRANAKLSLAKSYYSAGKKALALDHFRRIIEEFPDSDAAKEAQKFIDFEKSSEDDQ